MATLLVVAGVLAVAAGVGALYREKAGGGALRGLASGFAITRSMSRAAMWVDSVKTRPRTRCWPWLIRGRGTPATELGIDLGSTSWFGRFRRRVMASFESVVLVYGPPGRGKSGLLARIIRDAPGPVTAASTAIDLWELTHEHRERVGPCFVFNPDQDGDVPSTIVFPIVPGCDIPRMARHQAGALIAGTSTENLKESGWWEGFAHRTLYTLLMAAALDGEKMDAVGRWALNPYDRTPLDILKKYRGRAPRGWEHNLSWLLEAKSEKTVEGITAFLRPVVEFLADPSLARLVVPQDGDTIFDAEHMIRSSGTLYIVAKYEENSPLGPLTSALTSYVHLTAERLGARHRLDPPLGEVLDEAPWTARVPLPKYTSQARKYGMFEVIGLQERSGLADVWGENGQRIISTNATIEIGFNAISDDVTLEHLSKLTGHRKRRLDDRFEEVPVLRPDEIKNLGDGEALAIHTNQRAVILQPEPIWARPAKHTPRPTARPAATPKPVGVVHLDDLRAARDQREAS